MHILLTNDDGIQSQYLAILSEAAAARGHRVTVSAPMTQQSAKSHAFTLFTPLMAKRRSVPGAQEAWAVDGTPVDSCRVGMMGLCDEKPDLVISGINYGWNTGLAVYVSGTVGAAREAAFQGIPALAVSAEPGTPEETVRRFADYAVRLGEKLQHYPLPELTLVNVNAPKCEADQVKGAALCPISRNIYQDSYEQRLSPRGDTYFWLTAETPDDCPTPGSDKDLLNQGYLSITLLGPDGYDQQQYADLPVAW